VNNKLKPSFPCATLSHVGRGWGRFRVAVRKPGPLYLPTIWKGEPI